MDNNHIRVGNNRRRHLVTLGATLALVLVAIGSVPRGHTPIASRFTYNEHLFPIFRDRCGSCHIEGGVAPMSLVNYQAAYPWTQSIREEVMGLRMPPWQAEDGFGDFRNGHVLPAHEMDMILEWSSGGYPQGSRDQTPEAPVLDDAWALGEPTTTLQMPDAFELDAGTSETVRYFVLPRDTTEDALLVGVDFRPGAREVVRGATVFVDESGTARDLESTAPDGAAGFAPTDDMGFPTTRPVAVFTPGQTPVLNKGVGYPLPADADIVLRIHYKKTWITEGSAFTDQSSVGLHLGDESATALDSTLVTAQSEVSGREASFSHAFDESATVYSLLPEVDIESSALLVEGVRPDGTRIPMLWLHEPDRGWPTRFWFDEPVELPAGSQLDITAVLDPAATRQPMPTLLGDDSAPIRISVDYTSGAADAN